MSNNIQDKVVVITGASSGLGEETARHLHSLGAKVVLGDRRVERLDALVEELNHNGKNDAIALATDVTKPDDVKALAELAASTFGRVDVLLNNAGLMPQSMLDRLKIEDWNQTIDVNIKGVLHGIAAVLPLMQQQKSGHIINVASIAARIVRPGSAVYSASKSAVLMISEGLRQEVKPYNIRTTLLSPGAIDTELPNSITEPEVAGAIKGYYEQFAIPASSFARAVAYAISQPDEVDINEIVIRPTAQEL